MPVIRALLFDLCDTVVRTAGVRALTRHSDPAAPVSDAAAEAWFRQDPLHAAYETGQATTEEFLAGLSRGLRLHLDQEALARAYAGLVLQEIPGMPELLAGLRCRYPLFALSNNNPLLWAETCRVCTCLDLFERTFLSHQTGLLKPDPRAFGLVLIAIGRPPAEVALVDDNPACVAQARALGMAAVHFVDPVQATGELEALLAGG
ncbi:MAG: HAD-IA family hydrolase [Candidatus Latescibacterota bacterium]